MRRTENDLIRKGDNMINFETALLGLMIVSALTGLVTEGIKKILTEFNVNYYANTLAGIVSTALSACLGIAYIIIQEIPFTAPVIVYIIGMAFLGWLCAMVGYDKIVQVITQIKTPSGKE